MKLVIQRVSQAGVTIDGNLYSEIGHGLMVLLGVHEDDTDEDLSWCVKKLLDMRIFSDSEDRMNLSLKDVKGELLVVSQFTLCASTKKGNRPSFITAAKPEKAIPMYQRFISSCQDQLESKVRHGEFGADMIVALTNDGPVTIVMDSRVKT